MAMIKKRGKKHQATVQLTLDGKPFRKSASFDTQLQAELWAAQLETDLLSVQKGEIPPSKTYGDLLRRYRDSVVPDKAGAKWETTRINKILRDDPVVLVPLTSFSKVHAAEWRDRRKKAVGINSLLREWTILQHACTVAVTDWNWLLDNPFRNIARPKAPPPRTRRPSQTEVDLLLAALGCDTQVCPTTSSARAGFAWLFAIECAMRAGEIVKLRWPHIAGRVAHLGQERTPAGYIKSKNGTARNVPLTKEALRLLALIPRLENDDNIFQIKSGTLDTLFRRARDTCGIEDLHFHDSRREALTRLAAPKSRGGPGIDVLTLAKISGHRDTKILLNTYYAPDMEEVAGTLD